MPIFRNRLLLTLGMSVFYALPLSACQDTDIESITAAAPETVGAAALAGGLLSVPDLIQAQGLQGGDETDVEAWWDSWALSPAEGAQVREEVYPTISARLYPLLSHRGVSELLTRNENTLRVAKGVGAVMEDAEIETALEMAFLFHDRAWSALEHGDGEGALGLALHSADALRVVSPQQVASGLLSRAEDALRRKGDSPAYSQEELTRIRRLANGAKEALTDGDYPRAIRRAYYACQLLGVGSG